MGRISRRQFLGGLLGGAAAAGVAGWIGPAALGQTPPTPPTPSTPPTPAPPPPGAPPPQELEDLYGGPRSRLVTVVNPIVVKGNAVNVKYLRQMLAAALLMHVGCKQERDAWNALIKPDEKVLIKFNRSGAENLIITDPMLEALLGSMAEAGIGPERIMLLDVSVRQQRLSRTVVPVLGHEDKPVTILGQTEHLVKALAWADCLINVPFVKDHHLAGVTCAMKNLSHGLIKTPARWHNDRCRDAVPHLFALPAIRGKLRLTLCNALRIVVEGGPAVREDFIVNNNRLIVGADPVAIDAFAARLINQERGARGLRDLTESKRPPDFLAVARDLKLGQPDLDRVDILEREV